MNPRQRSGVVVVGSVTVDLTTFSERLPAPGETILGKDFSMVLGGKGANQAVAAGRAGAPVSFVACIGSDLFGDMITAQLTEARVDISRMRTVPGPSGIAHIRVDASAQNDIVMVPLANASLNALQVDTALGALADTCSVMLTQLETPLALTRHSVRTARAHRMRVILDPAPAATLPDELWADIDIVTPNETEATLLTGIKVHDVASARQAATWFLDRGVGAPIITLAEAGALVTTKAGSQLIAPFPVTPVDTTAAGDAFAGYLGSALAAGNNLTEGVRLASAAGALAVTRRGASPSLPWRADVDALLAERLATG